MWNRRFFFLVLFLFCVLSISQPRSRRDRNTGRTIFVLPIHTDLFLLTRKRNDLWQCEERRERYGSIDRLRMWACDSFEVTNTYGTLCLSLSFSIDGSYTGLQILVSAYGNIGFGFRKLTVSWMGAAVCVYYTATKKRITKKTIRRSKCKGGGLFDSRGAVRMRVLLCVQYLLVCSYVSVQTIAQCLGKKIPNDYLYQLLLRP